MWTRDDIITFLAEPYVTLTDTQRTAAAELAATDPEVAEAWAQCRMLAEWDDGALWGEPRSSDSAFLVALRARISGIDAQVPARRGAFGTARLMGITASICAVLMVVIFGAGSQFTPSPVSQVDTAVLTLAAALETETPLLMDSLEEFAVNPESLAVYLDMPELAESWDFEADLANDVPVTDELLQLDDASIEEVLARLEKTNFF